MCKDIKILKQNLNKYLQEYHLLGLADWNEFKNNLSNYSSNENVKRRKRMNELNIRIRNTQININQINMRNMNH